MKDLIIISDVTFDLIIKNFTANVKESINKYVYTDSVVSSVISLKDQLKGNKTVLIHFDSFFHRYADENIEDILNAIIDVSYTFDGNILISNLLFSGRHTSNLKENIGQGDQFSFSHHETLQKITASNNIYFHDFKRLISHIGVENSYNFKLGFLYQMPYSKKIIESLSHELCASIDFLNTPEKKAIFVDCDNTLWKGILGEDGLEGIQCNKNAEGVLFFHFQEFLLERKKEGFILGLCSKNNENETKEAFEKLNMPLKWDDFIIKKVNWGNKIENLRSASEELNFGLQSFIFIDDSDFEIQSVKSMLPEVTSIKLNNNYNDFLNLTNNFIFKRKRITKEDIEKNNQYIAEQVRNTLKSKVSSFEEYVKSLEIKLDVSINNIQELSRLSQLTEKTNQFNFNKEFFTVAQLEKFISEGNYIYSLKVSDKFGDYGTVGLILVEVSGKDATLRNYLLSCRSLGRSIEHDFYKIVKSELAKGKLNLKEIRFKETAKNIPAKVFYQSISS
jgi:FkbH-like protein